MPLKKSAKKALKKSEKRRLLNNWRKKQLKEVIKKFKKLIAEKKAEEAQKLLPAVYKVIDKAQKRNILKANNASRKKSALKKSLNQLLQETKTAKS